MSTSGFAAMFNLTDRKYAAHCDYIEPIFRFEMVLLSLKLAKLFTGRPKKVSHYRSNHH